MHDSVIKTGLEWFDDKDIEARDVLEVGAFDVNGSLRPHVESNGPSTYVGTDMRYGPGVDVVCDAINLVEYFGPESFDVVICTEMLEHALDWRSAISNMKKVLRPGGIIYLTTRSVGFPLHDFPADHWRFSVEDMTEIFSDFEFGKTRSDPQDPGVFYFGRKPAAWVERELASIVPHAMVTTPV